ncbi:MAG TPA: nitroreductase family deazaflavin-dependent oxidoreductase [Nitrososphaerales archaeon]|nr:nitroreductase family deazaflavin-dependent oxidoreductase [Nitrososphaerales archaeon]
MPSSDFARALETAPVLEITVVGRKTGKKFSTPVWFVREGGTVYLLPVKGASTNWYRNILKNQTIELEASGKRTTATAQPIKDKKGIEQTVARFTAKYGARDVKRYYPRQDAAVQIAL